MNAREAADVVALLDRIDELLREFLRTQSEERQAAIKAEIEGSQRPAAADRPKLPKLSYLHTPEQFVRFKVGLPVLSGISATHGQSNRIDPFSTKIVGSTATFRSVVTSCYDVPVELTER